MQVCIYQTKLYAYHNYTKERTHQSHQKTWNQQNENENESKVETNSTTFEFKFFLTREISYKAHLKVK